MSSHSRKRLIVLAAVLALSPTPPVGAAPAPPGPARITWSVPEVSETITAGTKKEVTITLRASAELTNVALWMSPSLEEVLTLNPTRFDSLAPNQDYKVVLTFEASSGEHGGTIQVKLGEATVPAPLTIALRVTRR